MFDFRCHPVHYIRRGARNLSPAPDVRPEHRTRGWLARVIYWPRPRRSRGKTGPPEATTRRGERTRGGALLESEERARALAERLTEADRRKDHFLATLSHELRNPLAPIRTAVQVIERAPTGGEQAVAARKIIARQG